MQGLIIGSALVIALIIVIILLHFIKKIEKKYYRDKIRDLEIQRNQVASTPVLLELSKVEPIIKNDKMEEKYNIWQDKFNHLRENRLSIIDDMLIDLDLYIDKRDYKACGFRIAKIELEIYKVRESADHLLEEIKDITLSEEKYRSLVIKLKSKYRDLTKEYQQHPSLYEGSNEAIELQLENIERKFLDFEKVMDSNQYNEVVHIVKDLELMVSHMGVIIAETPDVLLMSKQLLPKRMDEVLLTYQNMVQEGYPLEYLNIEYNIEESKKNIASIIERVNVLDLEGSMFDLKTMLKYYDSLFVDFEKERLSRKVYETEVSDFDKKQAKVKKIVEDVYLQMDDIKNMYDLKDEDIQVIDEVNKSLIMISDDYNKLLLKVENKSTPYSQISTELEELSKRLHALEDEFDIALKSLGNMHNDEERAREQLTEIQVFLKQSKDKIRSYKLPVISDVYFVQLREANEAIEEVIKELERKPIVIRTLNTRVDTARDLVLKLYNTTNEMIKMAQLAEMTIVYGNRYRNYYQEIEEGLSEAEKLFHKGKYKDALDVAVSSTSIVDDDIYRKMLNAYAEN